MLPKIVHTSEHIRKYFQRVPEILRSSELSNCIFKGINEHSLLESLNIIHYRLNEAVTHIWLTPFGIG